MELPRKLGNFREECKAKARLDLSANREKLKRRAREPEPVFGQLKHNHGYTRFRHFGKARVTMDLGFVFMALNILKLHKKHTEIGLKRPIFIKFPFLSGFQPPENRKSGVIPKNSDFYPKYSILRSFDNGGFATPSCSKRGAAPGTDGGYWRRRVK